MTELIKPFAYCLLTYALLAACPIHAMAAILTIIALEIVFTEDPYERAQVLRRKR